jgi:hypothetical protein
MTTKTAAPETIKCWTLNTAKIAANPARPAAHPLDGKTVTPREGCKAQSIFWDGSNYLAGCPLMVVTVNPATSIAIVAGPEGLAQIALADMEA